MSTADQSAHDDLTAFEGEALYDIYKDDPRNNKDGLMDRRTGNALEKILDYLESSERKDYDARPAAERRPRLPFSRNMRGWLTESKAA